MKQKYYKILTSQNTSPDRGFDYTPYLPENGNPGKKTPAVADPMPFSCGYHVTPNWMYNLMCLDLDNCKIYEVEPIGKIVESQFRENKGPRCIAACSMLRFLRDVTDECKTLLDQYKDQNSGNLNMGFSNTGDRNIGDCNTGSLNEGGYNTGHFNGGKCNSGNSNIGDYNSGLFNKGSYNSGNNNDGINNSGDLNNGCSNSGFKNTGNKNSGNLNIGNYNTGGNNIGDRNSGSFNVGSFNAGDFNIGNYHVGYFNIGASKLRMFNKETNLLPEDIHIPEWLIGENPFSSTFSKKDLRLRFEKAGSYDIREVLALPNFDYDIFEKITGISKEDIDKKLNGVTLKDKELSEHKKINVNPGQDCIELKPCPFCGSKNIELSSEEYHDKDVFYIVSCNNCGAQIEGSGRGKEAAEHWNTRCK